MPRKRKSATKNKAPRKKKAKAKRKLSARLRKLIAKVIVNSCWRVDTDDTEKITASGKEVSSGWQRCRVVELIDSTDVYPYGAVRVQYFDDEEDDEPLLYNIVDFVNSAMPAPTHTIDLTAEDVANSAVSQEQPEFEMPERGKLLPLELKRTAKPEVWLKNQRKFDPSWNETYDLEQDTHAVPKCKLSRCKLDCKKLTPESVRYARNAFQNFAMKGINDKIIWLSLFIRGVHTTSTDTKIWANYVRTHVQEGRVTWSCSFCKCVAVPSAASAANPQHRFKQKKKRGDSKFASCPDFAVGLAFKHKIVNQVRANSYKNKYYLPEANGNEFLVHREVFQEVFNVGHRVLKRCKEKRLTDGRSGASGRKPHQILRNKIDNFWTKDIEMEPSHYTSTSRKQKCVGVSSMSHGFLLFLAKHFPKKYEECKAKQFFPGLNTHCPDSLSDKDVPIMACDDCISNATAKSLTQVVCEHVPKFRFFSRVTATYNLTFKRPGTDECERCNKYHTKITLLRAMGRDTEANAAEDELDSHRETSAKKKLFDHHTRAQTFFSVISGLQHTRKNGADLPTYVYNPSVEWASLDITQSISMDAGSGLRTPFCRVGYAYFSRVLVTNVYHITDHGARVPKPYHVYLWNDKVGGKGPSEVMSIFLHFLRAARTGAKRLVIECDGCSGQVFNQYFFAMCEDLVDPSSDLCRALGAATGRPIFERIDIFRGEVGHTFMMPDRVHGIIRRKCRTKQTIASIEEYEQIIGGHDCNQGRFQVTRIVVGDGIFKDMKAYFEQSYKLGGAQTDIDNNAIVTRRRHWVNFGVGPSGGPDSRTSRHVYGAWRLRTGYSKTEVPCEIVVGRHTRPKRTSGEYVLLAPTLGAYQRQKPDFVRYEDESLCDAWRVEREITVEKVRDTHKLACLGLPEHQIQIWPCPDPAQCKLDRCPERARAINAAVL